MIVPSDYPSLELLFGAYFHQDWCYEHESPYDVLNEFRSKESEKSVDAARNQIKVILQAHLDDTQLGEALFQLGCYYDPSADGISCREWLTKVLNHIE